jgi:hypothetical protein
VRTWTLSVLAEGPRLAGRRQCGFRNRMTASWIRKLGLGNCGCRGQVRAEYRHVVFIWGYNVAPKPLVRCFLAFWLEYLNS